MKLSDLHSKSFESIILNLIKTRFGNLSEDNYELFFSSEYFNISNPFKINNFESLIIEINKYIKSNSVITIEYAETQTVAAAIPVLKSLFEFLKCTVSECISVSNQKNGHILTLNFSDKFKLLFKEIPSDKNKLIFSNNISVLNISETGLALMIYNLIIGLLYSFDETFGKNMVAFDLEATGLSKLDELTEIGALKIKNGVISEKFQTLINPERTIPFGIQELTNITPDMVKDAPKINEAIMKFHEFAGSPEYVVVHNGGFDVSAIRTRFKKYLNQNFQPKVYDTRALSQSVKPGSGLDLSSLSNEFKIILKNAHRALADAEATAKIFAKLIFFRNAGISYFIEKNLYKLSGICFYEFNKYSQNIDFRILFRASILYLKKSKKGKLFPCLTIPLKIKDFLTISEMFSYLKTNDLQKLFNPKETVQFPKPSAKINLLKYIDTENPINLNIADVSKMFAYMINNFYPFDSSNNKIPVFISDTLTLVSKNENFFFLKENGKKIKVINKGNINIKNGCKIIYRIDYERYGFFNLLARTKIYPLKILTF
ncbi:3'-5' exonuclease [Candidatus Dependentiae bacterium]|nr:3'-5' exonuclease [Candidatus Dependentiae bacterium]